MTSFELNLWAIQKKKKISEWNSTAERWVEKYNQS